MRREVEEDEAEQHRGLALVRHRPEPPGHVSHEVGDSHLAGQDERHGPGEEADHDEDSAHELEHSGDSHHRHDALDLLPSEPAKQLLSAMLREQQPADDAKQNVSDGSCGDIEAGVHGEFSGRRWVETCGISCSMDSMERWRRRFRT
jgi:hypothetical protein